MEDFKYIAITRNKFDIVVYGFYSKRVMLTATSSLMNQGHSVEVMDASIYKCLSRYVTLRELKEVINYKERNKNERQG